ncbi:MAG TPA: universal stress protein [Anaerolineales bacterium]|nr:universal stress protein [Anaerolineales bacterium]
MNELENSEISTAISDFRRARSQANLQELIGRITGESTQLLSFDEVKQKLRLQSSSDIGLRDIPLVSIVGSVGRYSDFTRNFLPRREIRPERWARVKIAASGLVGLPPIDVYKIGEIYFVKDGNHRVSVARQLGATHIQAYVTEVQTSIPLTPDTRPDDLILKAEYAMFLEKTSLGQLSPKPDLSTTVPGQYQILIEHIDVHRYYMGLEFQREIPYIEAAAHWYRSIYIPVVETIRKQGILRHFPNRTETDLYLWIAKHRAELEEQLGWQIKTEYAASNLAEQHGATSTNMFSWIGEKLLQLIIPEKLEAGPTAGEWRSTINSFRIDKHLFNDILVPLNGKEDGWHALEQAIQVAYKEQATLHGLHVIPESQTEQDPSIQKIEEHFTNRCIEAGVHGNLTIVQGDVVDQICTYSTGTDLVITNLSHPPEATPLAKLSPGFHDLIRRCPRPLFAAPQSSRDINSAILAFDASPKAFEALYLAAYLACNWQIKLTIISVKENGRVGENSLDQARNYLADRDIQAEYMLEEKPVAEAILKVARERDSDLLLMGGYSANPILQVVIGSTVDQVLRESARPVLICK